MGWRYGDKKAEMQHQDMKFLLPYEMEVKEEEGRDEGSKGATSVCLSLAGFCSFMLSREKRLPVIYIYEIHLFNRKRCRGNGLGKKLMELVETIGRRAGAVKSMLTVFTTNVRAEGFYRSLGYLEDQISPTATVLKNGKVKKPEYFILSKDLLPFNSDKDNGTEKGREEEDVALPIYDATDFSVDEDMLNSTESSENSVLL